MTDLPPYHEPELPLGAVLALAVAVGCLVGALVAWL